MFRLLLILASCLVSFHLASCSNCSHPCDLPQTNFKDFTLDCFIGKKWFVDAITPAFFPDKWSCWVNVYYKTCNGSYYSNSTLRDESVDAVVQISAASSVKNGNIIQRTFHQHPQWTYPYSVYDTDCYNYAIEGGRPDSVEGKPLVWVSYTSYTPRKEYVDAVKKALKKYGLDCHKYANDCPERSGKKC